MAAKASVTLVPGQKFQQQISAGTHTVISDLKIQAGGADGGPDPKELCLGSLAACTAMTILMVAPSRKWDIQELKVTCSYSEQDDPANPGTKIATIDEEIEVKGNLTQAQLTAIERTAGKCPVYRLLMEPKQVNKSVVHKK